MLALLSVASCHYIRWLNSPLINPKLEVLHVLMSSILSLLSMNSESFVKIFDMNISLIMLYSSELWGMLDMHAVENVQAYACQRFLQTYLNSCNAAILGDLGRFPIQIVTMKQYTKNWLRIITLPENR